MSIYNGRKNGWILEFAGLCERLYNTYYLRKNVIRDDGFLPNGDIGKHCNEEIWAVVSSFLACIIPCWDFWLITGFVSCRRDNFQ